MTTLTELKRAGINALEYKRAPRDHETKEAMLLRLNPQRKTLRFWPGKAQITVHPDKKRKQAVIEAFEDKRTFTHTIALWGPEEYLKQTVESGDDFPIRLPLGTKYHMDSFEQNDPSGSMFDVTITATVPATTSYFLTGTDESNLFVSMLPKKVTSVEEAHEVLRPKRVPKGSLRQGEWFFIPASKTMKKMLDAKLVEAVKVGFYPRKNGLRTNEPLDLGGYGEHVGQNVYIHSSHLHREPKVFAMGFIVDQHDHHKPVRLDDWHEVIRNTELETDASDWD